MSRYLVTGATGFLGNSLVDKLQERGHDVVALCRSESAAARALGDRGVVIRRGDILDGASVRAAAEGCDGAFHCAGKVSRKPEDAAELFKAHVEGTKITLDACRAAGIRRVVIASSSGTVAVSKDPDDIIDETYEAPMTIIGRWPYYRSKAFAEQAALQRSGPDFEVISLNPTILFGPGDLTGSSTGDIVTFLDRRVAMTPAGGLSFVDVRDAAEGLALGMEKGRAGERYLLSAANMTVAAFFGRLERISGVPAPRLPLPRSVRLASYGAELLRKAAEAVHREPPIDRISAEMAQHFWYIDATKAQTELGWCPRDPSDTLADTVADLYARGVAWPRA